MNTCIISREQLEVCRIISELVMLDVISYYYLRKFQRYRFNACKALKKHVAKMCSKVKKGEYKKQNIARNNESKIQYL